MERRSSRPVFSLRVKLVLSYLGVALGAMLLLIIVVTLVVQNYFYSAQLGQFRANAEYTAQQSGQRGNIGPISLVGSEPFIVVNANDQLVAISPPSLIFHLSSSLSSRPYKGRKCKVTFKLHQMPTIHLLDFTSAFQYIIEVNQQDLS